MIWIAFIMGLFIGTAVGIVAISLCRIAAEADRQIEEISRGL